MMTNLNTVSDFLKPFPAPQTVFADPVQRHARHLLPLVSVDLSAVHPKWQGWVHMLNPCEPMEGLIGQNTADFHNQWVKRNWLAFRLTPDNRYQWLGDWRYFELENPEPADAPRHPYEHWDVFGRQMKHLDASLDRQPWLGRELTAQGALALHYQLQHISHEKCRQRYAQYGFLSSASFLAKTYRDFSKDEPMNWLDQLGGPAPGANRSQGDDTGHRLTTLADGQQVPVMPGSDKPFAFVACCEGSHYSAHGADSILLFYEPDSRTVLMTFDYS